MRTSRLKFGGEKEKASRCAGKVCANNEPIKLSAKAHKKNWNVALLLRNSSHADTRKSAPAATHSTWSAKGVASIMGMKRR